MKYLIYFLMIILTLSIVSAFQCYNGEPAIRFNEYLCIEGKYSSHACQGGGYACKSGWDYIKNIPKYEYYCDAGTASGFVKCENGCNPVTGLCEEGYKNCNEGEMTCGTGSWSQTNEPPYSEDGDVYKCKNNLWVKQEECKYGCKYLSYSYAKCDELTYYCTSNNCIKQKLSGNIPEYCYDNYQECHEMSYKCEIGKYYCTMDVFNPMDKGLIGFCEDGISMKTIGQCQDKKCAIEEPRFGSTKEEVCGETVISNCGNGICEEDETEYSCPIDCGQNAVTRAVSWLNKSFFGSFQNLLYLAGLIGFIILGIKFGGKYTGIILIIAMIIIIILVLQHSLNDLLFV
jgi:hypothetical protein